MTKLTRKAITIVMVLTMIIGCAWTVGASDSQSEPLVSKSAEPTGVPGVYKVTLQVPGQDGSHIHDEVILMVDGSYSGDNEWPLMKEAIIDIGETVLNGNGNTQLTLMAFGMGDNEVLVSVTDAEELAESLGALPGNLLYGRSSTNCEAGFTGVGEFIEKHDGDTSDGDAAQLNEAHVIYISDGEINTDEHLDVWGDWQNRAWGRLDAETVMSYNIGFEFEHKNSGGELSDAFTSVFGSDANIEDILADPDYMPDFSAEAEDAVPQTEIDESLSEEEKAGIEADRLGAVAEKKAELEAEWKAQRLEKMNEWSEKVWADVFAYSGLELDGEYPVSDVERAFAKYDKENGTYLQDNFYYALLGRTYPDRTARTKAAAYELAENEKVESIYIVDNNASTGWMKEVGEAAEDDNIEFIPAGSIANISEALSGALSQLAKTPFNDVVLTDYMSKWVNLDKDSIKIIDNSSGKTIFSMTEGWLIAEEERPVDDEAPVTIELVDPSEYAAGGADVEGNTSGDIYKLTWNVKAGAMLRSDNYSLEYLVNVDADEEGYVPETEYPANGTTTVYYTDEEGNEQKEDITVPEVEAPAEYTLIVNYVDNNGNTLADTISTSGMVVGSPYDTEKKSIDGYRFIRTTGDDTSGIMDGDKEVTYVYSRITPPIIIVPTPTPEPTPEPTPTPTPTPEVTPEPTPEVTPEPSPEVTPEPSPEVSPEPSPEVTPEEPPVVEIPPEEPPVAEEPVPPEEPPVVEIPDEDTPTAEIPVFPPVIEIEDDLVPMSELPDEDVPRTGDNSALVLAVCIISGLLLLLLAVVWLRPRRD